MSPFERLNDPNLDPSDRWLLETAQQHGWGVIKVPEDDEGPGFAFSVGVFHTFNHPEVLMIGQKLEAMHQIINHVGERVRGGERFLAGQAYPDVLEGYECHVLEIAQSHFRDYLGTAIWFYERTEFPAVQLVWPDRLGRFPWDQDAHPDFLEAQPLLGPIPEVGK